MKKFNSNNYKLTEFRCFRNFERKHTKKGTAGNVEKLSNSLSRSKAKVKEYALSNPFELFVTFTLDPKKYDRTDLPKYIKHLSQFIRDFRKKTNCDVKYLFVPERHQDGCWHIHGFLMGLPLERLREFKLNDYLPIKILERLKSGAKVYTWQEYEDKFGFASIEVIKNQEASSNYILKYITKDALRSVKELNAHLYYASQGLKKAELIKDGILSSPINNPAFENEYVRVGWFNAPTEALKHFIS